MYYLLLVLFSIQISEAKFYLAEIGSADEGPGEQATRGGGVRISAHEHEEIIKGDFDLILNQTIDMHLSVHACAVHRIKSN